jgi:hypothetical protein
VLSRRRAAFCLAEDGNMMVLSADDFEAELLVNQPLAATLGSRGE